MKAECVDDERLSAYLRHMLLDDEFFMRYAIKEAMNAYEMDEVPVGAVVVSNGRVIGKGHNLVEKLNDVTAHAEMMAMTAA
ncbi:MAG: hypothetical protein RLZZ630_409, partial [Bacteroidota bacterium]